MDGTNWLQRRRDPFFIFTAVCRFKCVRGREESVKRAIKREKKTESEGERAEVYTNGYEF
jgi:hypothetical protein